MKRIDQLLGLRAVADHVSVIRSSQGPLGLAGCHFHVIAAARALVVYRREASAASSSLSLSPSSSGAASAGAASAAAAATAGAGATEVPAASSLLRSRRLAEFLYEAELRRSGRTDKARSTVRRLLASLLFWAPLPVAPEEDGGAGGAAGPTPPRPPGYGKLPRPVAGHEKTALSQFQVWLLPIRNDGYFREARKKRPAPLPPSRMPFFSRARGRTSACAP